MSIASKLHDKASITRGKRAKRPLKFIKCGRCGKEFHKSGQKYFCGNRLIIGSCANLERRLSKAVWSERNKERRYALRKKWYTEKYGSWSGYMRDYRSRKLNN